MFVSVIKRQEQPAIYPEVLGARVLITGLTASSGVDVARSFAEHKARLVIQSPDNSPQFHALAPLLAERAADMKLYNHAVSDGDSTIRLAQSAAQIYGGLDVVINLVTVTKADVAGRTSVADIEDLVSRKLLTPTLVTRVAANRMRLTWTEGCILNVVQMGAPETEDEAAIAGVVRATLAAMTEMLASQWADDAIRINAVGPRTLVATPTEGACLASDADVAELALYLAGNYGSKLSGLTFDAEGIVTVDD